MLWVDAVAQEFHLCKPLTSRPTNSEVYFVGKGFRGLPAPLRRLLEERLANFSMVPFLSSDTVQRVLGKNPAPRSDFIAEMLQIWHTQVCWRWSLLFPHAANMLRTDPCI